MRATNEDGLGTLLTEARRPDTEAFDRLTALGMVEAMHRADGEALEAVRGALPELAGVVEQVATRLRRGGRLLYAGAGTSGRLGVLDASECVPTFNVPPGLVVGLIAGGERALREAVEGAEDDEAAGARAARAARVSEPDAVVGIAASGRTPWVLGLMAAARAVGALVIGLSCVPGSAVAQAGELAVTLATGAEVVTGSTRLKAGTATKLALNMISTGAMARLGYVHGNLMVNVQPTNAKLRDRAVRIVQELCAVGPAEAAQALAAADGEVKTAVVSVLLRLSVAEARERLRVAGGVLREALPG